MRFQKAINLLELNRFFLLMERQNSCFFIRKSIMLQKEVYFTPVYSFTYKTNKKIFWKTESQISKFLNKLFFKVGHIQLGRNDNKPVTPSPTRMKLFVTDGKDQAFTGKCIFFLRTDTSKPVTVDNIHKVIFNFYRKSKTIRQYGNLILLPVL